MHSAALLLLVGLTAAQHPTYIDGVPDHEQPWVAVCKNHCHLDGAPVFHNALKHACNNYRFVMPKPRVYSRCRNGFIDGMELACHNFCATGSHSDAAAEQKAARIAAAEAEKKAKDAERAKARELEKAAQAKAAEQKARREANAKEEAKKAEAAAKRRAEKKPGLEPDWTL